MSLKHAILVLLENEPGSGSDLVQRFRAGIGNFWQATHQQVYQELKKLHTGKQVQFEVEAQETTPEKKIYRITRTGQRVLKAWLRHGVKPPRVRDALLIKVFGAHHHDRADLLVELEQHRALHRESLKRYRALEALYLAQDEPARRRYRNPYLTLRRGLRYEQDSLEWLEEVIALIAEDGVPSAPVPGARR